MIERARPLLGTYVAVRVAGLAPAAAHAAIDAAFAEIALVHRLMSFHDPASDVSRLNREAASRPVAVHAQTLAVLRVAQEIAEGSGGCFDVTVGGRLAGWRLLPRPAGAPAPDPAASWRDLDLRADGRVRFGRPLWIDLGGIAKGHAVDRAIERLRARGVGRACVNAGGDLRVLGPGRERIRLRPDTPPERLLPVVELEDGSLASSSGRLHQGRRPGPHVDAARRRAVGTRRFACVVAERCIVADALTKVVLGRGARSERVLRRYGATAHLHSARQGWRSLGLGA